MFTAHDIASYFFTFTDEEAGEDLTNLKLQKLCYYAQGFYLALHGTPLFPETIEAWQHGPVVPDLYHIYKEYGNKPVKQLKIDLSKFSEDLKELLNEIYDTYGQFSAWKLRDMTHQQLPWEQAYKTKTSVISTEFMKNYFKKLLVKN